MYSVVGADGSHYGPVNRDVLVQWAREGRIVARTSIRDHDTAQEYLACDIPELAAVFSAPPVTTRPPSGAYPAVYAPAGPLGKFGTDGRPLKSRMTAGLLGLLLPGTGIHRFYLGYVGIGILQILSNVLCFAGILWGLIEGIICLTGGMTDSEGRPLAD